MQETINQSRPSLSGWAGKVITALLLAALPAVAQQPTAGAASAQDPPKTRDKIRADPKVETTSPKGTSNDRLFYALPNFLTLENATQLPPLTAKQKFQVAARSSFDYVEYPWYGALAGISQAENSESGFGQGAAGYAKRYAAMFADGTIENFMTSAILPSLLKEDPRFYQSYSGTVWRRTGYAVSRIFVTRTDSGHEQFNFSEILGAAIAAGAEVLVTGDKELLEVGNIEDVKILSPRQFWEKLRARRQRQARRGKLRR